MATVKQTVSDWRAEVLRLDPEHPMKYRRGPEYEFSNKRVFEANYQERGPYGSEYD